MAFRIAEQDPHFLELEALYHKYRNRRTKAQIFSLWAKSILPDQPQINEKQFINWTRSVTEAEGDAIIQAHQQQDVDLIEAGRTVTLVQMENKLRKVGGDLVDEASTIMESNKEDAVPLKERYFALTIVEKMWGKLIKEKEIAIKAHAEKRESVGMFAKLLRSAMSGELTMEDVDKLKNINQSDAAEPTATTETIAQGTA